MKKTTKKTKANKKAIKAVCNYQSTYTYHGIVELPIFGGRIFNHGTASSKNTRTKAHIRECEKNDLTYEVLTEKQDRLFGNTVIAPAYDKEFIAKVVEQLNNTVLKSSVVKAMSLRDWQSSLPVLTSVKQGYYDSVCKAKLSETECCFVPDVVNQADLEAAIDFVEQSWYYVDKALRVPANKLPGALHFTQKHLVSGKLVKVIRDSFSVAKEMMYTPGNTIVIIGQVCPESIATFAMINNVIIWHDSADQKYVYKYDEELNDRITYIETMEELLDICMNIDPKTLLIIANPPYGKPGADIAKTIVDDIDYAEFVLLLPVSDYKRNETKDLYKYADLASIVPIKKGFADAVVTTHIARITRQPSKISLEEFEIENYTDPKYKKYFYVNDSRKHFAIDNYDTGYHPERWTPDTTFIIGQRAIASGSLPKGTDNDTYRWNVEKSISSDDLIENHVPNCYRKSGTNRVTFSAIIMSSVEKANFTNFVYSSEGFKFIAKIFTAVNTDAGTYPLGKVFPKVDWTRPWTVKELLADYGYTQAETDEIMADLVNYSGMED